MGRSRVVLLLAVVCALVVGCASGGSGDGARRQSNLITADEIPQAQLTRSTHDMIRALRPNWLQARGVQSLGSPAQTGRDERGATGGMVHTVAVYIDGSRAGGPEMLQQIPARDVLEARFLTATEAASRLGADHPGGAILVTLRR